MTPAVWVGSLLVRGSTRELCLWPAAMLGCGASSGLIAARNAAQKSVAFSRSLAETAPRVLSMQRDFLRSVPWIKRAYGVPQTEAVRQPLTT